MTTMNGLTEDENFAWFAAAPTSGWGWGRALQSEPVARCPGGWVVDSRGSVVNRRGV